MVTRLYVTNLSHSVDSMSVRRCFAACGEVDDVELVIERNAPVRSSAAFVTMLNSAAAELAVRQLNGTMLEGRVLMVSVMAESSHGSPRVSARQAASDAKAAAITATAITQQYRERHNMTYELNCAGSRLVLRVFFPADEAPQTWRVAALTPGASEVAVERTAPTKRVALDAVAQAWVEQGAPSLDWQAVTRAMEAVRAI